ncbi:hypothetical protein B0H11DRAFT_1903816 [Mycena galericulata]|nr:hypothetical protein B0H11DRAFT_1903816 [Mycena galericulata]
MAGPTLEHGVCSEDDDPLVAEVENLIGPNKEQNTTPYASKPHSPSAPDSATLTSIMFGVEEMAVLITLKRLRLSEDDPMEDVEGRPTKQRRLLPHLVPGSLLTQPLEFASRMPPTAADVGSSPDVGVKKKKKKNRKLPHRSGGYLVLLGRRADSAAYFHSVEKLPPSSSSLTLSLEIDSQSRTGKASLCPRLRGHGSAGFGRCVLGVECVVAPTVSRSSVQRPPPAQSIAGGQERDPCLALPRYTDIDKQRAHPLPTPVRRFNTCGLVAVALLFPLYAELTREATVTVTARPSRRRRRWRVTVMTTSLAI